MWSRATRPRICFGASVGGMRRKYEYRRTLPQYQKDGRALFITFGTWRRWELPEVARDLALEAFVHAHGRKYNLHAAVVMLITCIWCALRWRTTTDPFSIPEIMQAIKSESAHRINKALGRGGRVWQDESFDHVLRNDESLNQKIAYVLENPVRAGLVGNALEYGWFWHQPDGSRETA